MGVVELRYYGDAPILGPSLTLQPGLRRIGNEAIPAATKQS